MVMGRYTRTEPVDERQKAARALRALADAVEAGQLRTASDLQVQAHGAGVVVTFNMDKLFPSAIGGVRMETKA
jgi:hypothetical protein